MDLNDMIKLAWNNRQLRLAKQKELDDMYAQELELMGEIKHILIEQGKDFSAYGPAQVKLFDTVEPSVVNWQEFQDHIRSTGQLDLLQKRPMVSAIKARWEAGDDVPGVIREEGTKITISAFKQ